MRWFLIALAVLTFAFAGAGCGGGDDESAGDDSSITITDDTSTDTSGDDTTEETTDDTTDTTVDANSFDFAEEDCQALIGAYAAFSAALGSAGSGDSDLSDEAEAFRTFAEKVPDEIQDDVQVLASAYQEYAEKLAGIDLQSGAVPSADQLQQIQEASAALGPEVTEASENLSTWTTENCQQ
jgi:hypothetical protein